MRKKIKRIKKSHFENIFFSIFFALLFLLIIGFLFYSNLKIGQRRQELNLQIKALKEEIQILEQKSKELQARISDGSKEQHFLEKEARERFNLKKPGEEVVTILSEKAEQSSLEKEKLTPLEILYSATIGKIINLFR